MIKPLDLRSLCQVLLNGLPDRAILRTAEDFVKAALLETPKQRDPPGSRLETWMPVGVPSITDRAERQSLLLVLSPTMLLEGTWLARISQPATGHLSVHSHLFAIYCRIVGLEDDLPPLPQYFKTLLTHSGIHLPPVYSPSFFSDRRFPDFALTMPCLHLALMHRSRTFLPELLGYTLAHCFLDWTWSSSLTGQNDVDWRSARGQFLADVDPLISNALESYRRTYGNSERIGAGWQLYRHTFESLLSGFAASRNRHLTVAEVMADIVKAKRPHAVAYHHRIMLQGHSLDQWLTQAGDDPAPLLAALRSSPYVDLRCPVASRLIRAMDFGGPMFGVFTPKERQSCLAWIENPGAEAEPVHAGETVPRSFSDAVTAQIQPHMDVQAQKHPSLRPHINQRVLFTALLRAESAGDCPPEAAIAVERILRRSRWLNLLKPIPYALRKYDPAAFSRWVEAIYQQEAARYRPLSGDPRVRRTFCLWAVQQLAPSILVDGCWLAGVPTSPENLDEVGRLLLRIYADELGNGKQERNHANVYRRLLESLEMAIPDFETERFARDPRFTDAAFDLPVYMLAIGLLKDRYFPELLGLNLAIELSGLGAGYMQASDILRHYGIDPTIIQLHQTIDNLGSGHAARARDAILLYLDRIRQQDGLPAAQNAWRRIRLGYVSLRAAILPLAGRFLQRYLGDRLKPTFPRSRTA